MKAHIKMHQHNAPFNCEKCSYSTHRYNALKDHLDLHTEDFNGLIDESFNNEKCDDSLENSQNFIEVFFCNKNFYLYLKDEEKRLRLIRSKQTGRILCEKIQKVDDVVYRCYYCMEEFKFLANSFQHSRFLNFKNFRFNNINLKVSF